MEECVMRRKGILALLALMVVLTGCNSNKGTVETNGGSVEEFTSSSDESNTLQDENNDTRYGDVAEESESSAEESESSAKESESSSEAESSRDLDFSALEGKEGLSEEEYWEQYPDMMNQFLNLNDSVSVGSLRDVDFSNMDRDMADLIYGASDEILLQLGIGIWAPLSNEAGKEFYLDDEHGIVNPVEYTNDNGVLKLKAEDFSLVYMKATDGHDNLTVQEYEELYIPEHEYMKDNWNPPSDADKVYTEYEIGYADDFTEEDLAYYFGDPETVISEHNFHYMICLTDEQSKRLIPVVIIKDDNAILIEQGVKYAESLT